MNAPVAEGSVGKVEEITKTARMNFSTKRAHWCGAAVHIPVKLLRWFTVSCRCLGTTAAVNEHPHQANFSSSTFLQELHARQVVRADSAVQSDLNGSLTGQLAVVTGKKDVSAASKVVKNFAAEFDKLKLKFGYLNNQRLNDVSIIALADLPSIEVLRAKILGLLNAPATKLAVLINTPAAQLAQVIKAKSEKAA